MNMYFLLCIELSILCIFSHLIIAKQVYKSRPYFDHPVIDEEAEKQRRCVNWNLCYPVKKQENYDLTVAPRFQVAQTIKRLPTMRETQVRSLGQEDPLEKEMATPSSILAWRIPWTVEPGRLQSMGSRRVGHDWATSLSLWMIAIALLFN